MNEFLNRRRRIEQPSDPEIETKLRLTLQSQADKFEPASDGYVRLQQRVESSQTTSQTTRLGSPRIMAAAAAVLLVVGVAGFLGLRRESVNVIADSAASDVEQAPITTTTSVVTDESPATTDATSSAIFPLATGLIAAPLALSPVDAAEQFLSLVRLDGDVVELRQEGTSVLVYGGSTDRSLADIVATLHIEQAEASDGGVAYVVARATGPSLQLDAFPAERVELDALDVAGSAPGWSEEYADLRLYSSNDGVLLDVIDVYFDEMNNISEQLQVQGVDHGWVVLSSAAGGGDHDGQFVAEPVFFNAASRGTEYQVAHIPVDDPDGGLLLRHLPGHDQELVEGVGPLPAGTTGIYRRSSVPNVGSEGAYYWWAVELETGERGWVNARFLTSMSSVSESELAELASAFHDIATDPDLPIDAAIWPELSRKPVQVGWTQGLANLTVDQLTDQDFWDDQSQTWTFPEASGAPVVARSLRDFLNMPVDIQLDFEADESFESPFALDQEATASNFADLARVTIGPADTSYDTAGSWTTLFVEQTPDGPRIVGVSIYLWTP